MVAMDLERRGQCRELIETAKPMCSACRLGTKYPQPPGAGGVTQVYYDTC
jgi:hypothetical protein